MSDDAIRRHLRAALEEVVSAEKARLHQFYDKSDADIAGRIRMMEPIIASLNALKAEAGEVKGLKISPAPHGHMATIDLDASASRTSLSISTNLGNSKFQVEEHRYYLFSSENFDEHHEYSSAEDVLKLVVDAVGKHIASNQVLSERKK
ncbi:MAG: hypothetical protein BroJett031_23080 [Betaproteobacteria bacterium]|nr:MAG: hypothetical protein BroJett031_23080 [Betaproteobacteria bacterium]